MTPFADLLSLAFQHLGNAEPTIVAQSSEVGPEESAHLSFLPGSWRRMMVSAPDQIPAAVASALDEGPVLLVPPWGGISTQAPTEELVISCRPADDRSLLCALLPLGTLTAQRTRAFRCSLMETWQPILSVEAAGAIPGVHVMFEVAALFLAPASSRVPPLRMFKLSRTPENPPEKEFLRLLKQDGGEVRGGYVLREPLAPGVSLGFDRNHPRIAARKADLRGYGDTVPLTRLFRVRPGHLTNDHQQFCPPTADGAVRVLTGREIERDGTIAPAGAESVWAQLLGKGGLQSGDLVMRAIHRPTDGGLVVAEVRPEHLPLAAGDKILILRPDPDLGRHQHQMALLFLRSPIGGTLAAATGAGQGTLNPAVINHLLVPQPDEGLATALEDLQLASDRFDAWKAEADELMLSIFQDENALDARKRLVTAGRQLRMRYEAAELLDDPSYTIRTRYPYPIAYRWRTVEAELSAGPSKQAYGAILDAGEILLCYAANLAFVMAHAAGVQLGAIGRIRDDLMSGRGPAMGHWTAVLNEVAESRELRKLPDDLPLGELRGLLRDEMAREARQRLTDRRNDEAHLRNIDNADLEDELSAALTDLETLLRQAQFLTDLPLIQVQASRWDSYRRSAVVAYKELMGDHAVVPTKTMSVGHAEIEQGSLYVIDSQRTPHLLRPFLTGRECPMCRNWETFAIDAWVKGRPRLKSLEHGHTVEDPGLEDVLTAVGMLA